MSILETAIPLLTSTLGYTYDVPSGKFADPKSCKQQVISWEKYLTPKQSYKETYGGKDYRVPNFVDFRANTTSDYTTTFGKSTLEYSQNLSISASVSAEFPGFSGSATADYSKDQRSNVANEFTRISYNVTHYIISLPDVKDLRPLINSTFLAKVDAAAQDAQTGKFTKAFELFNNYGTHLVRSVVVGGRGAFISSTDSREYNSSISVAAAAKISASYFVASGSMELSVEQKQAMASFNSSSTTSVQTEGGDPRYGNENFLKNVGEWAASTIDYPSFVDFGPSPSLIGVWKFASTPKLDQALMKAYGPYTKQHTEGLKLPGPYLHSRLSLSVNTSLNADFWIDAGHYVNLKFPTDLEEGWYLISPLYTGFTIAQEIQSIKGVLSPVTWKLAFDCSQGEIYSRFWKAITPSQDYVALGCVGISGEKSAVMKVKNPPKNIAGRFRAVHKSALTGTSAIDEVTDNKQHYLHLIDGHGIVTGTEPGRLSDYLTLNKNMVIFE